MLCRVAGLSLMEYIRSMDLFTSSEASTHDTAKMVGTHLTISGLPSLMGLLAFLTIDESQRSQGSRKDATMLSINTIKWPTPGVVTAHSPQRYCPAA